MPHVLLINPNTREALTAQLLDQLRAQGLGDKLPLHGITADFGADYIASESSYVVAAHAVLDAWQRHLWMHGRPAAVLVACFGDPGVWALRESAGVPVMGLAEAAMREADVMGPFAIVTGGTAWGPMLERLARGLQLGGPGRMRRVLALPSSGGELMADPVAGERLLGHACRQVLNDDAACEAKPSTQELAHGAHEGLALARSRHAAPLASIILGGAALGGWCDRLDPRPDVAMIDSVAAGGRWLRQWG
jgi:Asp/Glu/hydantoin racemase